VPTLKNNEKNYFSLGLPFSEPENAPFFRNSPEKVLLRRKNDPITAQKCKNNDPIMEHELHSPLGHRIKMLKLQC